MTTHNLPANPTVEQLLARIQQLEAERNAGLAFKIGKKGAISVYGLGRNPLTQYHEQWVRFLDFVQAPANSPLRVFMAQADGLGFLASKGQVYQIPDRETLTPDELSMFSKKAWDAEETE